MRRTIRNGSTAPPAPGPLPGWQQPLARTAARLSPRGIDVAGFLQLDGSSVFAGGQPNPLSFDGQYLLDVSLSFDTQKLVGWPGGTFFLDAQTHGGPSILTHQMPALQDPDNMDAYTTTSVDRARFQQSLWSRMLQLQVGLMYVDDQFFSSPFPTGRTSSPSTSLPTPQSAPSSCRRFPRVPSAATCSSTEAGWQSRWRGHRYKIQLGAWRDTGRFRRFDGSLSRLTSGIYGVASAKLWQPEADRDRGLGTFVQFGTGPPSVAAVQRHYGGGLVWTGPLASRPHDEAGFAFSDSVLTTQDAFLHGFENEFEAYYQIAVLSNLTVQPDLEYWLHPGGMGTPNTLLGLTRMVYSF